MTRGANKEVTAIFGLYDKSTVFAVNRLLKTKGVKLKVKTRREDDQIEVTLEELQNPDLNEALKKFRDDLLENTVDEDPEIARLVRKNFWKMFENF